MSDHINDLALKPILSMKELQKYTGLSRDNTYRLARQSGAEIRLGRRVFVNRVRFEDYLDKITG